MLLLQPITVKSEIFITSILLYKGKALRCSERHLDDMWKKQYNPRWGLVFINLFWKTFLIIWEHQRYLMCLEQAQDLILLFRLYLSTGEKDMGQQRLRKLGIKSICFYILFNTIFFKVMFLNVFFSWFKNLSD